MFNGSGSFLEDRRLLINVMDPVFDDARWMFNSGGSVFDCVALLVNGS